MTSSIATPTTSRRQRKGGYIVLAAGAAAALALGVGIGVWQNHGHHGRPATVHTVALQQAAGGGIARSDAVGGAAEALQIQASTAGGAAAAAAAGEPGMYPAWLRSQTQTVDLVSTEEQATAVRAALAEAEALREQFVQPSPMERVLVVDPNLSASVQQDIAAENQTRAVLGLPAIVVNDLTQPVASLAPLNREMGGYAEFLQQKASDSTSPDPAAAPGGAAVPNAPVDPESYARWVQSSALTVELAGSQEQADSIRAAVDLQTLYSVQSGGSPLAVQVLVVGPGEDAQTRQLIADENQLRAALGLPAIVVRDARPAANSQNPYVMDR